jgi:hypothetical protein
MKFLYKRDPEKRSENDLKTSKRTKDVPKYGTLIHFQVRLDFFL